MCRTRKREKNKGRSTPGEGGSKHAGKEGCSMSETIENRINAAETAPKTEYTKRMERKFGFFGPATFLYAAFYAFCMVRNSAGVSFPFFMAGSLLYMCFCLSKLEISLKKGSIWYMTGMMLLAVSTFCTDDLKIVNLNKTGIFLLMMSLLLKQFYDTSKWRLGKYLGSIVMMVFGSLGEVGRPFADFGAYLKEDGRNKNKKLWSVLLGVVIALPLLFVAAALLGSADAVFRQMTKAFFDRIQPANICNVLFRILFLFFASYLLLAFLCRHTLKEEVRDGRTWEPIPAMVVTGMLSLLYLFFSGVQIFGLFLQKLALPEGYTYAEYAREGFFQLLAVSILNLVIVLCVMSFVKKSRGLQIILTVMSLCTFVMIASSAMRMVIYIRCYDLTFLRIFVLWALAVLFVLFVGVIINIFREGFPLFRYSVGVVTVLYLMLSFSHPDYLIARVNLAKAQESLQTAESTVDYDYLSTLSTDAAPVLLPYLKQLGYDLSLYTEEDILAFGTWEENAEGNWQPSWNAEGFGWYYLNQIRPRLEKMSPRTYNISRHMALQLLEKYGADV